jgi:hypothetical protein
MITQDSINKSNASFQRKITRLKEKCIAIQKSNDLRKYQISRFHDLLDKLLKEKRITKSEIYEYIVKKRVVKLKNKI